MARRRSSNRKRYSRKRTTYRRRTSRRRRSRRSRRRTMRGGGNCESIKNSMFCNKDNSCTWDGSKCKTKTSNIAQFGVKFDAASKSYKKV